MKTLPTSESLSQREGPEFEDFYRANYRRLAQGLFLLVGSLWEAEELAQEAMTRALERWERVRHMESPAGYVYATAINIYRSQLRRLALSVRRLFNPAQQEGDPAESVERRNEALEALSALSSAEREAVVLVEWFGLDDREAGRALGIAPSSVRGRLHRARKRLRDRIGGIDE